jgi:Uma2 family endonuclease
MAENTLQYQWIVTLQGNLDLRFADRPDVFVAGDHLIYAQEGNPKRRAAPDVYVAFGRPKGHRGSYKVWAEGGVFPQVVIEVLAPGNRKKEMRRKYYFYQKYGAAEYLIFDPDNHWMKAYHRTPAGRLGRVPTAPEYVSPLTGVRYVQRADGLTVFHPTGEPFLTMTELGHRARQADAERQRADAERQRADAERQRADAERQRADAERQRAERLAAKFRALGLDPDAP